MVVRIEFPGPSNVLDTGVAKTQVECEPAGPREEVGAIAGRQNETGRLVLLFLKTRG